MGTGNEREVRWVVQCRNMTGEIREPVAMSATVPQEGELGLMIIGMSLVRGCDVMQ